MKDAAKAEKKAMKEFEKNYKELQERHYKHQQTGREKNLIVPEVRSSRTSVATAITRKATCANACGRASKKPVVTGTEERCRGGNGSA